jgi:hypothetical protein
MQRTRLPLVKRLLSAAAVAVVVPAGIWIAGGVITNDFMLAMWLTGAWMALAGLASVGVALRLPALRVPVLGAYVVVAALAGIYLSRSVFLDDTVSEKVVTAPAPAPAAPHEPARGEAAGRPRTNVRLREGRLQPVRHAASGRAAFVDRARRGNVLTLTGFEVDNGPDLRVYLVRGPARTEAEVRDYVDVGALKGNRGDQQYELPDRLDPRRYSTVVVWCRAFSVLFARAPTRP